MISSRFTKKGFTIIELLVTVSLIAALALVMITTIGRTDDANKIEQTRARMEALRVAILGNDNSVDNEGKRNSFGYLGDTGSLPTTLADLVTKPTLMQTWIFNTLHGIGSGWRGPYVVSTILTGDKPYDTDAWGTALVYSTAGTPSILSYGSNKAAGGTGYAADISLPFETTARTATVRGNLEDNFIRRSGYVVTLAYPSGTSAALTTTNATTDAQGYFGFSGVPFGVRSLRVTSPSTQTARKIVVDRSEISVPSSVLNLFGTTEAVTYVGSAMTYYATLNFVYLLIRSTYTSLLQLDAITVTFSGAANLTSVTLNGVKETFTGVASGVQKDLSAPMTLTANEIRAMLELGFSAALTSGTTVTVVLSWVGRTRTDTVSVTLP